MSTLFDFRGFMNISAEQPSICLDTSHSLVAIAEEIGFQGLSVYVRKLGASKLMFGAPM